MPASRAPSEEPSQHYAAAAGGAGGAAGGGTAAAARRANVDDELADMADALLLLHEGA